MGSSPSPGLITYLDYRPCHIPQMTFEFLGALACIQGGVFCSRYCLDKCDMMAYDSSKGVMGRAKMASPLTLDRCLHSMGGITHVCVKQKWRSLACHRLWQGENILLTFLQYLKKIWCLKSASLISQRLSWFYSPNIYEHWVCGERCKAFRRERDRDAYRQIERERYKGVLTSE